VVRNSPKILLLLACLLAGFFLYSRLAFASPLPVAINPTRIEITAAPGQHVESSFKFWNGTDAFLPVHLQAADFSPQGEEGQVAVDGSEAAVNSLKSWLKPEYADMNVAPKQEFEFRFALDVPVNADPGSHWGTLLVITSPQSGSGTGAAIQTRIGLIILVNVLGDAREKLSLESFSAPRFLQGPPLELAARFRNEGTVHEAPLGSIAVRNWFGSLVATGTLPVRNVLPGTVRKITASVGDGVWLGRYDVALRASYGAGEMLEARAVLWVVPWQRYGPWFAAFVVLASFVFWRRKRLHAFWYTLKTGLPPPDDYH
jgi:hypothetical protein